ncbi:MAG TPA: SMC-Scp complex subunit ScpB [Armatimonadota bacterium]|jgi:segregation and condensation protein B
MLGGETVEGVESLEHSDPRLRHAVEALLFAATEPLTTDRMARVLEIDETTVYQALVDLRTDYHDGRGVHILPVAGGYQMVTHPDFAPFVGKLLAAPPTRLSRAALETLSIVAYRQPITIPEIEAVRGVSSDGVVRTLVERGLIHEAGQKETPGRPNLFVTTEEFLVYFGLKELTDLPSLETRTDAPE